MENLGYSFILGPTNKSNLLRQKIDFSLKIFNHSECLLERFLVEKDRKGKLNLFRVLNDLRKCLLRSFSIRQNVLWDPRSLAICCMISSVDPEKSSKVMMEAAHPCSKLINRASQNEFRIS